MPRTYHRDRRAPRPTTTTNTYEPIHVPVAITLHILDSDTILDHLDNLDGIRAEQERARISYHRRQVEKNRMAVKIYREKLENKGLIIITRKIPPLPPLPPINPSTLPGYLALAKAITRRTIPPKTIKQPT